MYPVRGTAASCAVAILSWFAVKILEDPAPKNTTIEAGFDDAVEDEAFFCDPCPQPPDPDQQVCRGFVELVESQPFLNGLQVPEDFCDLVIRVGGDRPTIMRTLVLLAAVAFAILAIYDFAYPLDTIEDLVMRTWLNRVLHGFGIAIVTTITGPRQWPTIYVVLTIAEGRFLAAGFCLVAWALLNLLI